MTGELERIRSAELSVGRILGQYESAIAELIPRTGVTPAAFMVSARMEVARDEYKMKIAMQNPESMMTALMKCAILGHVPGTRAASLVAFGGKEPKIEVLEQYHGIINRAQRAAPGLVVASGVVRQNDVFIPEASLGEPVRHTYPVFGTTEERGQIIGVYAQARLPQGTYTQSVTLSIEQISKIKAMARTATFWNKWPEEMAMKAAIRRIRGLPESSEWRQETDKLYVRSEQIGAQFGASPPLLDNDDEVEFVDPSD